MISLASILHQSKNFISCPILLLVVTQVQTWYYCGAVGKNAARWWH